MTEWDTKSLQREFIVEAFLAPRVRVTRKADGVKGWLTFNHSPRVYFDFDPDEPVLCDSCGSEVHAAFGYCRICSDATSEV